MTPAIRNGILHHLHHKERQSTLWVSAEKPELPSGMQCEYYPPALEAVKACREQSFDYAVVADLPGELELSAAEALLARLRDINAQRVFWVLEDDAPWNSHDAIALGFRQLQADDGCVLYGFDIENYKTTPDWLNPRHWAHPERWDKERW